MNKSIPLAVYDNIFDAKYLVELYDDIKKIPLSSGNVANKSTWPYGSIGTHDLLGSLLYSRTSFFNIKSIGPSKVFELLDHFVPHILKQRFELITASLNAQYINMDGTFHTDTGVQIIMYVTYPWDSTWGGELEVENDNKIEKIEYVPGRMVVFDGSLPHRGLAPKVPNVCRYSINYRGFYGSL